MNSDKFLVIAGTVITALLLIVGGNFLIEQTSQSKKTETVGHTLPNDAAEAEADAPAAGTDTAAAPAGDPAAQPAKSSYVDTVVAALGSASAESGEKVFRKCKACHLVEKDAGHRSGPNLWNIVGRDKGGAEGYSYSKAMTEKDGAWTPEALAAFMKAPKEYVEGTKMNFRGLKSETDAANLIAYLQTLK